MGSSRFLSFLCSFLLAYLSGNGQLSGQRASACTCKADASEHPGPNVNVGRGAPESTFCEPNFSRFDGLMMILLFSTVDILEQQIDKTGTRGLASQSLQFAPFTAGAQIFSILPLLPRLTPLSVVNVS